MKEILEFDISKFKDDSLKEYKICEISIGEGNLNKLPKLVGNISKSKDLPILLVMDDTLIKTNGRDIKDKIYNDLKRDFQKVEKIILHHKDNPGGIVHADFKNIDKVKSRLTNKQIVISIGSGTITDITKHATFLFAKENNCKTLPFIVVQTANTVTAFTSNIAVLYKDGVKRTYSSRYPDYVISDISILCDAPLELTQAGFGDLLARYVSYADWYLGYRLKNLPTYSDVPKDMLDDDLEYLLTHSKGIKIRDKNTTFKLTKALLNAGISMSIVGMSTPISGYEHVISHVLDMISTNKNRKPVLHGLQVGLATVISAYVYEQFLENIDLRKIYFDSFFPDKSKIEKLIKNNFIQKGFNGKNIKEILSDYSFKYQKWINAKKSIKKFIENFNKEKIIIKELIRPGDVIKRAIQDSGIELKLGKFNPPISCKDLNFAFLNAHFIRKRFTIGDLLYFGDKLNQQLYDRVSKRIFDD